MPQTLNTILFKLKPLLCVAFGLYAFAASYPGSFTSSYSHAEQQVDCKTVKDYFKVISWTGNCVNGLIDGDGELIVEIQSKGKTGLAKRVGKFVLGDKRGVYFDKSITPFNGQNWCMLQVSNDDKGVGIQSGPVTEQEMLNYVWYDQHYEPERGMTFDDAFAATVNRAKRDNVDSIDPKILKEYLLGRYKFTKAVPLAPSSSPELENQSDGTDDPKVFGGSSSPKEGKRKK